MFNLMRLELKKINLKTYLFALLAINILIFMLTGLTVAMTSMEEFKLLLQLQGSQGLNLYGDMIAQNHNQSLQILMIYAAVLSNELFIKEYNKGTLKGVFTSPVSRKNVFIAKTIVYAIISIMIFIITNLVQYGFVFALSKIVVIENSYVTTQMIIDALPTMLGVSVGCALTILIPTFFGLKKKSMGLLIGLTIAVSLIYNTGSLTVNGAPLLKDIETSVKVCLPVLGVVLMGVYISKDLNKDITF
ncbi:MAG: ABC transporter permease subunit [Clostridium sp.]